VSKGRLTRQELGWLLTQEAQGAAERLRKGVQALTSVVPAVPEDGSPGVESTLAALDDAVRMLSSLHHHPVNVRGRRGRIDLASLLWEVAPEARVSIEPGSGTEVLGDEAELRRMIHVLIGHGSGSGSSVTVKRDGDMVRISVALGPDSSATVETERAWLGRMATRYGGEYALEGGTEHLSLPAEGADERAERERLERELEEARRQGEAYARELAQVFLAGEEPASSCPAPPVGTAAERFLVMTRMAGGTAAALRGMVSPIGRELQELRPASSVPPRSMPEIEGQEGEGDDRGESIRRRLLTVHDFVAELGVIGELDAQELFAETDLCELARASARALETRVARTGVEVQLETPDDVLVRIPGRAGAAMVRAILSHALASSPKGSAVRLTISAPTADVGARLVVDDTGTSLPASARRSLLTLDVEPGTYGRPTAVPLYCASEIATYVGASFELADAPAGGLRVMVTFPSRHS
jgi:signal transduction histidine kinase